MSRRLLFQFFEQPEQNTFSMFMLPMMKTVDNSANQMSDSKSCETEKLQQMNKTDLYNNGSIFCSDDIDEEEEENTNVSRRKSYASNDDGYTRKRTYASSEDYSESNVAEALSNFENLRNEKNRNYLEQTNLDSGGDQFQRDSDDQPVDEYKNQPDLVQSCYKVTDDRKLRKLE